MALDLDAIAARAEAATPGPWYVTARVNPQGACYPIRTDAMQDELNAYATCRYASSQEDAAFIAAARADVPALVAEVRRLRTLETELRGFLSADGPSLAALWGIAPDATGGVLSEEWVRQQREAWAETDPPPPDE